MARALVVVLLAGCTSVGIHDSQALQRLDFGPPDTVSLCLYLDQGIGEERARALVEEAWRDDAPRYALYIKVGAVTPWRRPAFMMHGIIDALRREPLTPGCDRILALIGRHFGDIVWGFLLPEYLGAVNEETMTHGYATLREAFLNNGYQSIPVVVFFDRDWNEIGRWIERAHAATAKVAGIRARTLDVAPTDKQEAAMAEYRKLISAEYNVPGGPLWRAAAQEIRSLLEQRLGLAAKK